MCMINCCVYNRSVNRTLFPWRILSINEPGTTIEQYFEQRVFKEIEDPSNRFSIYWKNLWIECDLCGGCYTVGVN